MALLARSSAVCPSRSCTVRPARPHAPHVMLAKSARLVVPAHRLFSPVGKHSAVVRSATEGEAMGEAIDRQSIADIVKKLGKLADVLEGESSSSSSESSSSGSDSDSSDSDNEASMEKVEGAPPMAEEPKVGKKEKKMKKKMKEGAKSESSSDSSESTSESDSANPSQVA